MSTYTELKPFRFWCQKVLPLVYDDSISYYELLCKVVDYLNTTMENVDYLHDEVTDMYEAWDAYKEEMLGEYTQLVHVVNTLESYVNYTYETLTNEFERLGSYVENYFENLDVQEEIDNKLDEMAQNGTLTALLQAAFDDEFHDYVDAQLAEINEDIDEFQENVNGQLADMNEYISEFQAGVNNDIEIIEGQLSNLSVQTTNNLSGWEITESTVSAPVQNMAATATFTVAHDAVILEAVWQDSAGATGDSWFQHDVIIDRTAGSTTDTVQVAVNNLTTQSANINIKLTVGTQASVAIPELTDIRVGADGVIYSTAGDAVRGQVSNLNADIAQIGIALNPADFEQGGFNYSNNTATKENTSRRLRTISPVYVEAGHILKVSDIGSLYYSIFIFESYDSNTETLSNRKFSSIAANSTEPFIHWHNFGELYIPVSGYMVALIGNGRNWITSTDITPANNTINMFISAEQTKNIIMQDIFSTVNAQAGVYVKESDGTTGTNSGTSATDYIDISGGYNIVVLNNPNGQVHQGAFYDANKAYVSGYYMTSSNGLASGDAYIPIPTNAKYIRVSYVNNLFNSYKLGVFVNCEYVPRFHGKKMNCLGDSITYGYIPDSGAQMLTPYPEVVKSLLGLQTCRNYGVSGSTLAVNSGNYSPMCTRYNDMDNDADIVLVFGGTNDYGRSVITPSIGNINDNVNTTIYGALNIICSGLITKYPKAFIFLCTPLKRADKTAPNAGGYTLEDVAEAIRQIGKKYGMPVLDLNSEGGFYIGDSSFRAVYGGSDKLHPNQDFDREHLGPMIARFIDSRI